MISSEVSRSTHVGNGVTVAFATGFLFYDDDHVEVRTETDGVLSDPKVNPTFYSVTGAGNPAGGTVTTVDPVPTGTTLVINRVVPFAQGLDYVNNDAFEAEAHEQQMDLTVMGLQQLKKLTGTCLRVSNDQIADLGDKSSRASKYMGFDENGNPVKHTAAEIATLIADQVTNFAEAQIVTGTPTNAVAATAATTLGANKDLQWTWGIAGEVGNGRQIAYLHLPAPNLILAVQAYNDIEPSIVVLLATNGSGVVTTTAADVLAWLAANPAFTTATAALASGSDGSGLLGNNILTLAGGVNGTLATLPTFYNSDGVWWFAPSNTLTGSNWKPFHPIFVDGTPAASFGSDGMVAIDQFSGVIYRKSAGAWATISAPSTKQVLFVTSLPSSGTGANGDLAVIYTDGIISGLAEKSGGSWSQIATNAVTPPTPLKPTDLGVISLVDHFLGGGDYVSPSGRVGELNWRMTCPVGTGGAKGTSSPWSSAWLGVLGVLRLFTGSIAGNAAAIQFSNGTDSGNTFPVGAITSLTDFVMRWRFKLSTTGTFYLGFSNNPASTPYPTRFIGLRTTAGTTNFQFEATNGTPTTVDSGVAVDADWHTFELAYDAAHANWLMSLDGGDQKAVARVLDYSLTITVAAWVNTPAGVVESLYLDTFQLYGVLS